MKKFFFYALIFLIPALMSACSSSNSSDALTHSQALKVLAVESFLADITRNVAGERASVDTLIPLGMDPHAFEPTPKDVGRIADSDILVLNGAGFEAWLNETVENAGGSRATITASDGLIPRNIAESGSEHADETGDERAEDHPDHALDPHFWFDPTLVVTYVENIRDGLIVADPAGREYYTDNAKAYIATLNRLNDWAVEQINQIPPENRQMVTNHESFGYFADRYGFRIVGAVLPSVSSNASPSAKQLTDLVQAIRESGAKAIFLETGANPEMAQQIAAETGVKVVTGLYSHSLSEAGGPAATYVDMMRYNIALIVSALK